MGCGSIVRCSPGHAAAGATKSTAVQAIWLTPGGERAAAAAATGHCCSTSSRTTAAPPPPETSQDGQFDTATAEALPPSAPGRRPPEFSAEERRAAWSLAGFHEASAGQREPLALWIIGPSAVGKSTLASDVAPELGVPVRPSAPEGGADGTPPCSPSPDAVVLDGEHFRSSHSAYQQWAASADWVAAYPTLKLTINREKRHLLMEAVRERKHLIIPHTCLDLSECLSTLSDLAASGYTSHVLAVTAPREEVARRGRARESSDGKRYAPSEFEHSVAAFGPMIAACNGSYRIIRVLEPDGTEPSAAASGRGDPERLSGAQRYLLREVLASGTGGCEPSLPVEVFA